MVVVGTWNLENLYRPGGQFGPKDQAAYDAKLTTLSSTINAAAPDVLAVQEVGDPAALDDLVARLPGAWTITLSGHPDPRGIRVGFLTRTGPTASTEVVDFPPPLRPVQVGDGATDVATGMGRGAVHIHLDDLGGAGWDMVTVHLKSKLLSFPGGRFTPCRRGRAGPLRRVCPVPAGRRGRDCPGLPPPASWAATGRTGGWSSWAI